MFHKLQEGICKINLLQTAIKNGVYLNTSSNVQKKNCLKIDQSLYVVNYSSDTVLCRT